MYMMCLKPWHVEGMENNLSPAFHLFSFFCSILYSQLFSTSLSYMLLQVHDFTTKGICYVWDLEIYVTKLKSPPSSYDNRPWGI